MFYILEIINRLKYLFLSFLFLFFITYNYYDIFFIFLDFLFKKILNNTENFNYYIYTHPFELYYNHIYFCFIITTYTISPYIIWHFIDFNKTTFYFSEYNIIIKLFKNSIIIFIIIYIFFYSYIIPFFLQILQFAKETYNSPIFTIFFELKVQDFINFILYLNTILTLIIVFLLLITFIILNISIFFIIQNKKLLYLINILFATFISPPDIFSQLILLFFITIIIEIIFLIRLLILNIKFIYGNEFVDNKKK